MSQCYTHDEIVSKGFTVYRNLWREKFGIGFSDYFTNEFVMKGRNIPDHVIEYVGKLVSEYMSGVSNALYLTDQISYDTMLKINHRAERHINEEITLLKALRTTYKREGEDI